MRFKRFFAFILAVIMLMSVSTVSFAAEESFDETVAEETLTEENIPEEDLTEKVATVSVCSCIYVWPISGHTWIYVHNYSGEPIQVGLYEVPAGQGVSVGSFSFSVRDGWGLYYNLEAYRENRDDNSANHWTITKELNADELEILSSSLKDYPNYWGFAANCATFAFSIWNSVTGDHFFSLLIPAISQFMVRVGGGEKGVMEMYYPTREQIFRQVGSGGEACLEPVSDETFNR